MTQSLYNQIDKACSVGCVPIVKALDGKYIAVAPFKDRGGDWRESIGDETIEEAKQGVGAYVGVEIESWNRREQWGFHLVEIWRPQWEAFEVGDKVENTINGRVGKVLEKSPKSYNVRWDDDGEQKWYAQDNLKPALPTPEPSVSIKINGKEYSVEEAMEALKNYKRN